MGSTHGIGVKRNGHHRKNRKENKGHRFRFGSNNTLRLRSGIRIVKRSCRLTSEQVEEFNAREEAAAEEIAETADEASEDDEIRYFQEALSSLDATRFLYLPPFLKPEEIKRRRFDGEMNDDWWRWEEETGESSKSGRPGAWKD
jgi:hypothetical protein